jgi:hypothetical protein
VGETGKSMKVGEMVVAQEDGWRKIAISLIVSGANLNLVLCRLQAGAIAAGIVRHLLPGHSFEVIPIRFQPRNLHRCGDVQPRCNREFVPELIA